MIIIVALAAIACWICSNPDVALSLILGQQTKYSAGYSESEFRRVRVGMSEEEVVGLIGAPIYRDGATWQGSVVWYYSMGAEGTSNHWRREVWFSGGVVQSIQTDLYID